jgi:hypothetical protein
MDDDRANDRTMGKRWIRYWISGVDDRIEIEHEEGDECCKTSC